MRGCHVAIRSSVQSCCPIWGGYDSLTAAIGGQEPRWTGHLGLSGTYGLIKSALQFSNVWLSVRRFAFGSLAAAVAASCVSADFSPVKRYRRRRLLRIGGG